MGKDSDSTTLLVTTGINMISANTSCKKETSVSQREYKL